MTQISSLVRSLDLFSVKLSELLVASAMLERSSVIESTRGSVFDAMTGDCGNTDQYTVRVYVCVWKKKFYVLC